MARKASPVLEFVSICSITDTPVLNSECTHAHIWPLSAKLSSKKEHPSLCHAQLGQRRDHIYGVATAMELLRLQEAGRRG